MPPAPTKPKSQALDEHAPWKPAKFTDADAAAFQALSRGSATAAQQKQALAWLIEKACLTYDLSYRPGGAEGDRDTVMAEGRRSVGLQVVKLLNIKIGQLRREGS